MLESNWTQQGATLSHNNACKEFGLTEDEIFSAIKLEKLQYKLNYAHDNPYQNYAHGNPYYKLLRSEVKLLAIELHGAEGVKEVEISHKLKTISTEMNSLKRKLSALEKQRIALLEIQQQAKT